MTNSYALSLSKKYGTLEIAAPGTYRTLEIPSVYRTAFVLVWHPANGGALLFDYVVSRVGDSQPHQ